MAQLALALWAVYFVLVLGLRIFLHRRRTGRSGMHLGRHPLGSAPWMAQTAEVAGLGVAVAAPVLSSAVAPIDALDVRALHIAGALLFGLGLASIFVAQEAMGAAWRVGIDRQERTGLVTTGPFGLVRNPIYTSLVAVVAGSAMLVPSWLALLAMALIVVYVHVQARLVEEPHLLAVHGEEFASYARRVGRFLPGAGRLR